jgi:hypothetical protein
LLVAIELDEFGQLSSHRFGCPLRLCYWHCRCRVKRSGQIAGNHRLEETPSHPTGKNGLWNTELTERACSRMIASLVFAGDLSSEPFNVA